MGENPQALLDPSRGKKYGLPLCEAGDTLLSIQAASSCLSRCGDERRGEPKSLQGHAGLQERDVLLCMALPEPPLEPVGLLPLSPLREGSSGGQLCPPGSGKGQLQPPLRRRRSPEIPGRPSPRQRSRVILRLASTELLACRTLAWGKTLTLTQKSTVTKNTDTRRKRKNMRNQALQCNQLLRPIMCMYSCGEGTPSPGAAPARPGHGRGRGGGPGQGGSGFALQIW